jgi:hypothetical protein
MRFLQNAVLAALKRVQLFLDEYAAVLAVLVDLTAARKRLDDVVASFAEHAYNQDAGNRGAKGESAKQRQLRLNLRAQQMDPIALIARKNLRTTPEFAALQMPKPTVSGQAFIASAKAMADAATVHKDTFNEHGLPATFLDDFKAAITKLDRSINDREQSYNRRLAATKGLDTKEKQGRLVLSVLDSLVEPALADNDALLRGWQGARQIRRRPGPTTSNPATPGTPATSVAGASPATPAAATSTAGASTHTTPTTQPQITSAAPTATTTPAATVIPTASATPTTPTTPPVAAA